MSYYAVNALVQAGIKEIAMIVSPSGEEPVRNVYGDGSKYNAKMTYVVQPEPLGIANAILLCEAYVNKKPFVVYLGDNIMHDGISDIARDFASGSAEALVLTTEVADPRMFGVACLDDSGRLAKFVEKPKDPPSNLALVGVYFLRARIFEEIRRLKPSWRGEYEITEALQGLLDDGFAIEMKRTHGWWKDTGTVNDLLEANSLVLRDMPTEVFGEVEKGCQVFGNVRVELGARIHSSSVLRGPCVVGEGSRIGPDACIGPYTSVGKNVEVLETEIDNSIVMDECKIRRAGRIVDSIIGSRSSIGSTRGNIPRGSRIVVGENSVVTV